MNIDEITNTSELIKYGDDLLHRAETNELTKEEVEFLVNDPVEVFPAKGEEIIHDPEVKKEKYSMNQFEIIEDVAIFSEDEMYDKDALMEIIKVNNFRIENTETGIPIIVGHKLSKETKELEQPPIVGYASNLKLGLLGNLAPKNAIFATFKILKECVDLAKKFPRRSVELWLKDKIIDPIAILSASRPAKDLGLLQFSHENDTKITKYIEEEDILTMDKSELTNLISEIITQSEMAGTVMSLRESMNRIEPVIAEFEKKKVEVKDVDNPKEDDTGAEVEGDVAEESKLAEEEAKEAGEHPELPEETTDQIAEDHVEKEEATAPGPGNTFSPDLEDEKKKKHELESDVEKYKLEAETKEAIVQKYVKELNDLATERNEIVNKLKMSERSHELLKLSYVYSFNLDDETKFVESLDDEQYAQHLDIIQKRYSKVPVDRGFVAPVIEQEKVITKEQVLEVVKYATKNNMSFELARKELLK